MGLALSSREPGCCGTDHGGIAGGCGPGPMLPLQMHSGGIRATAVLCPGIAAASGVGTAAANEPHMRVGGSGLTQAKTGVGRTGREAEPEGLGAARGNDGQ